MGFPFISVIVYEFHDFLCFQFLHDVQILFIIQTSIRGCIQKFPDGVDNEIYAYLWYYSLRSNIKGYGCKTYYTDSQNRDTTAPNGRELYYLQFSLHAASPETFGYTIVACRSPHKFHVCCCYSAFIPFTYSHTVNMCRTKVL
jgi:hypothetical protein